VPKAAAMKSTSKATPEGRVPRRIENPSVDDLLAIVTRAIFQAGMSWAAIDARWEAFAAAFADFNAREVAAFGDFEIEQLMLREGIVHSRKKIVGTIANARTLIAVESEFGSFHAYVGQFDSYSALASDLKKRIAYLGDLNVYYLLFRAGEPVPRFEDWEKTIEGDHPRMREMVALGRSLGKTNEVA
jgi:3-methyladenine DNA glycosylase Tag